jgi:ribose 5-phosphate isomerase RpiB
MRPSLYLASDSLGSNLREALKAHLQAQHPEYEVKDLGTFDKYYEGAYKVQTTNLMGR